MNKFTKVFMLVLCLCLLICGAAMAQECQHASPVVDYHAQIEPTCTEPAYVRYECADGCVVYGWATPADGSALQALGHAQHWLYVGEPDCTKEGLAESYCWRCGLPMNEAGTEVTKEPATKVVKELGHIFNNGTLTKAPTCVSTGEVTYTCDRCGVKLVVTAALVKDVADGKAVEPQWAKKDVKGILWADVPAKIAINPNGHKFGARQQYHAADGATCHKDGMWHKICELCGIQVDASTVVAGEENFYGVVMTAELITKYGDAYEPDHHTAIAAKWIPTTFKTEKKVVDSTCTVKGYEVAITYCTVCDEYKFEAKLNAAEDGYDITVTNKCATCVMDKDDANKDTTGYTVKEKDWIPHVFNEDHLTIVTPATCDADGAATGVCLVCKTAGLPVVLKKLPHNYSWDATKLTYDETIDAEIETATGKIAVKYPTCTAKGYIKCVTCDCHVDEIDEIAHTPVTTWYNTKKCSNKVAHADATATYGATCLLAADYHTTCVVCGAELTTAGVATKDGKAEVKHVAAKGHDWGEWSPVNGASATSLGYKDRVCNRVNVQKVTTYKMAKGVVTTKVTDGAKWACNWLDNFVWVAKPTCTQPGVAFHYYYNNMTKEFLKKDCTNDMQLAALKAFDAKYEFANPEKETLAVIDHTSDGGKVVKEATKEAPGLMVFSCTVCGAEIKSVEIPYVSTEPVYELQNVTFVDGALEGKVVLTAGDACEKLYVRVTFFFADESTVITETFVEDGEFDAYANGDVTAVAYVLTDAAGSPIKVPGTFTDLAHGGIAVK